MDPNELRAARSEAVPFNRHLGLEIRDIGAGNSGVRLPAANALRNHLGTQHAGALFSAGEAASGAAFLGAFVDRLAEIRPLATKAKIAFLRTARGPILAIAHLDDAAHELLGALLAEGLVRFPVRVDLRDDEDRAVAEMTVHWHVRLVSRKAAA